jgi:hypothetical protein
VQVLHRARQLSRVDLRAAVVVPGPPKLPSQISRQACTPFGFSSLAAAWLSARVAAAPDAHGARPAAPAAPTRR